MSRYFITGATGFLGGHLARKLRDAKHEVVALCRNEKDGAPLAALGVTIKKGDILDARSVTEAAKGCTGAFHCAGLVSRKADDAELLYRVHVEGTKTTLDACKAAGVTRVVVASTSGTVAVGDDPHHIFNENDEAPIALVSRWPYYRTKLFAEGAALERNSADFAVISINPSLLLGPGDLRGSSTADVRLFLEKKIPAVPSGGLAFVDVRDAAEAMILAMDKGTPGERYLISACNVTMREFFARLERASGVRAPWVPLPPASEISRLGTKLIDRLAKKVGVPMPVDPVSIDLAQHFWYVDATKAETALGWRSRDPLETLRDTVHDLRVRGVVWPEPEEARP